MYLLMGGIININLHVNYKRTTFYRGVISIKVAIRCKHSFNCNCYESYAFVRLIYLFVIIMFVII